MLHRWRPHPWGCWPGYAGGRGDRLRWGRSSFDGSGKVRSMGQAMSRPEGYPLQLEMQTQSLDAKLAGKTLARGVGVQGDRTQTYTRKHIRVGVVEGQHVGPAPWGGGSTPL